MYETLQTTDGYIKHQEHLMQSHHQIDMDITSKDLWITKEVESPGGLMDPKYILDQDCSHPSL